MMMMMNKIRTRIKTRMSRRNEDEDYNEKGGDGEGVGNLVHWIRRGPQKAPGQESTGRT